MVEPEPEDEPVVVDAPDDIINDVLVISASSGESSENAETAISSSTDEENEDEAEESATQCEA
jgi:hypothetical protein